MAHLTLETKAGATSFWVSRDISGGAISAADAYFRELAIGRDTAVAGTTSSPRCTGTPWLGTGRDVAATP